MSSPINKLKQLIDDLILWQRNHKETRIPLVEQKRISEISKKLLEPDSSISDQNLQLSKKPSMNLTECSQCGAKLNPHNVIKHKEKCTGKKPTSSSVKLKKVLGKKKATNPNKPPLKAIEKDRM